MTRAKRICRPAKILLVGPVKFAVPKLNLNPSVKLGFMTNFYIFRSSRKLFYNRLHNNRNPFYHRCSMSNQWRYIIYCILHSTHLISFSVYVHKEATVHVSAENLSFLCITFTLQDSFKFQNQNVKWEFSDDLVNTFTPWLKKISELLML